MDRLMVASRMRVEGSRTWMSRMQIVGSMKITGRMRDSQD